MYAAASWDTYTVRDTTQLETVQRRAARFAKSDFRRTTSITQLLTELDWSQLGDRRRVARLSMFFKAVHGLVAIPTDKLLWPSRYTRQPTTSTRHLHHLTLQN